MLALATAAAGGREIDGEVRDSGERCTALVRQ